MKIGLIFLLVCITGTAFGQTIKEIEMKDRDVENYFVVEPQGEVKGAMILLPGGSYAQESIFPETKLHNFAYLHNILVVALDYGKNNIYLTDDVLHKINAVLTDVIKRYDIPKDKFVIGDTLAEGSIR